MSIEHRIVQGLNSVLSRVDAEIVRKSAGDAEIIRKARFIINYREIFLGRLVQPPNRTMNLPKNAASYLQKSNRRFEELNQQYSSLRIPATNHLYWTDGGPLFTDENLKYFRGDFYVFQTGDVNCEINYLLTSEYIKAIDHLGIFDMLIEDDLFGVEVYKSMDGKLISRDLLDSIVEIYFLEDALNISKFPSINILDIGAGYGRLAHRMVESMPNINKIFCVDAVPASTFISEYYLNFRKVDNKALVVPLNKMEEDVLEKNAIDLAINIHSFTECSIDAVEWWLDLMRKYKIRYIMIVPSDITHVKKMFSYPDNNGKRYDFVPLLIERGYKLVFEQPKYLNPLIQRYGVSPKYHYLFELML